MASSNANSVKVCRCGIKIMKNGPYIVSGRVPVSKGTIVIGKEDCPERWEFGGDYPRQDSCGLCRCGESKSKPFCDGRHIEAKFNDGSF